MRPPSGRPRERVPYPVAGKTARPITVPPGVRVACRPSAPCYTAPAAAIVLCDAAVPSGLCSTRMERPPLILIVDDDPEIRRLLGDYLVRQGLRACAVGDGAAMWRELERHAIDLVVLDIMLPGDDGLELCRRLRARSALPVIMLTARGDATDRIVGLELGADDYLSKPFDPRELLARIRATLRRSGGAEAPLASRGTRLRFAGWSLDRERRELRDPDGTVVALSSGEFRLLEIFLERPNRALGRDLLLELLQGREATPFDRSVDVQVSRLRRRLRDDPRDARMIKTVRNAGYLFAARVERGDA